MTLLSLLDPSRGDTQTTANCREQVFLAILRHLFFDNYLPKRVVVAV